MDCYNPAMRKIVKHAAGTFCYVELATTGQNQAKQFYGELFGWSVEDVPMGPGMVYTTFRQEGLIAAAASQMSEKERASFPAHWHLYIAVESADAAAKRAVELGGTLIEGPFDVAEHGRMAVLQDPAGAYFSIWEARKSIGIEIADAAGTLCWADLVTRKPEVAREFYQGLFGWEIATGQHGEEYLHIKNGAEFIGGIPPVAMNNPYLPPHWMIYFAVDDVDAAAAKVVELGGKVLFGPVTMENVGRIAVVADGQGAAFSVFKLGRG